MITPKPLAEWCVKHQVPAVAIADFNSMFGALEFSETLVSAGVQPIMACCFDVTKGSDQKGTHKLSLYAQNQSGYERLMEMSSIGYLDAPDGDPCVNHSEILSETDGLILLTGGSEGEVGQLIHRGLADKAKDLLIQYKKAYPNRVYVEITRHGKSVEKSIEAKLVELAYELSLPIVATHDVRFMKKSQSSEHSALMGIADRSYVTFDDEAKVSPEQFLKTPEEMRALFSDLPEAVASTIEIAQRCAVCARTHDPILPRFPVTEGTELNELHRQAKLGLENRFQIEPKLFGEKPEYEERLEYELSVIEKMGYPGYFLIVSDFVKWAKNSGIPVGPGRGSGAGSLVAWALQITDIDPLRFDLLFERFLNPDRVSMPDFDIDFCQDRRNEVIRYARDKYGADCVAMIITFGSLQARAAVRDVGRVLSFPYSQMDRLAKLIPANPANPVELKQAVKSEPRFQEEIKKDPRIENLLEIAQSLEGLHRNASTHAAGVIIADRPIKKLVPLYKDPDSELPATQFSMKYAEKTGLVKFDFLGLKTLTMIEKALAFIRRDGKEVDSTWETLDDEKTFQLIASGNTLGVFQLDGQGVRDVLRKVRPTNIEEIIAITALYRPGPMDNIPLYIQRKFDPKKIAYEHPALEPVLKTTFGIPVYQEQVIRMAQVIAGYSLGEADILRRAMGKKIKSEMEQQREKFVTGAKQKLNVEPNLANRIFDTMEKFAGYGFNKSHAAAYSVVAYRTAYLKAHYPVAFIAASMSLDSNASDKLFAFHQDAKRLGVKIETPDINTSQADFDVVDNKVVYALSAMKGVGMDAMSRVVKEREQGGKFRDVFDFAERVDSKDINKKSIEQLAKAGAFDSLVPNRACVHDSAEMLAGISTRAARDRQGGQSGLFGSEDVSEGPQLPKTKPWSTDHQLDQEFDSLGFYLNGHPLDDLSKRIDKSKITTIRGLSHFKDGTNKNVPMIGLVRAVNERRSKKGDTFAFVSISDTTGEFEPIIFAEAYQKLRELLVPGRKLALWVHVEQDKEKLKLNLMSAKPLEESKLFRNITGLKARLKSNFRYEELKEAIQQLKGINESARGNLFFEVPMQNGRVAIVETKEKTATNTRAEDILRLLDCVEEVSLQLD